MKTGRRLLPSLLLAVALVPAAARAEPAVTTQDVNMRAGPDASYPRVATLGRGVTVDVVGCVEGWQWCDVIVDQIPAKVFQGFNVCFKTSFL